MLKTIISKEELILLNWIDNLCKYFKNIYLLITTLILLKSLCKLIIIIFIQLMKFTDSFIEKLILYHLLIA